MVDKNSYLVYIDDSGDPGFKSGASSNFIMAAAVFMAESDALIVSEKISELRKSLKWKDNHEFKFRKAKSDIKKLFLKTVKVYDFEIYAAYIDKRKYKKKMIPDGRLYYLVVEELLKNIPLKDLNVKIDGSASKDYRRRVVSSLRKNINKDVRKVEKVEFLDSNKNNLIQLADMIAGSVNRSMQSERDDSDDYIKIIRGKIKGIFEAEL